MKAISPADSRSYSGNYKVDFLSKRLRLVCLCMFLPFLSRAQGFTIDGRVDSSFLHKHIYFWNSSFFGETEIKPVKVEIKDGRFSIPFNVTEPGPAWLSTQPSIDKKNPQNTRQFILDKDNIQVLMKGVLSSAEIRGSETELNFQRFATSQQQYIDKLKALDEIARSFLDRGTPFDSVLSMYHGPIKEVNRELDEYRRQFIKANPDSFVSLLLIPEVARASHNYFEADSIFASLDDKVSASPSGRTIEAYINEEKKLSVGSPAPDFALSDTSGNTVGLSSVKGKYVLLDFWAAWCQPCRQENPNIVRAFNKYSAQGFTVFGVSLDQRKADWLKAIRTDGLNWSQVSDLQSWKGEVAVLYRITSIPRNFLLDPNGKIIARDLRGPDLRDKLEEIFGR